MKIYSVLCVAALAVAASPAIADPHDHDGGPGHGGHHDGHGPHKGEKHHKGKKHDKGHGHHAEPAPVIVERRVEVMPPPSRIVTSDAVIIRQYYYQHNSFCPPGLAKRRNGCLPPGHARRYVVGEALPPDVVYYQVPQPLLVELQPVPVGYQYVQVDQNVLLINEATRKVVDAITLLSAVR